MKSALLIFLSLAPSIMYAQSGTQTKSKSSTNNSVQEALNTALCDCFSKNKELKLESEAQLSNMFLNCLETNEKASTLFLSYLKEKGIAMEDEVRMQEAGRDVGHTLTSSCPIVFRAMLQLQSHQQADSIKSKQ